MKTVLFTLGFAAVALWAYNIGTVNAMVMETNAAIERHRMDELRPSAAGSTEIRTTVNPALEATDTPSGQRFDDVQPQAKAPQ